MKDILYIVVPCYNEQEVLGETSKRLLEKINNLIANEKISSKSRVMFIDDGSMDSTWDIITELHNENPVFLGVKLSRNRGHQNALLAGLSEASKRADIIISMDADLQDDINAVDEMLYKYYEGCDIVYGVRAERKTDTFFKKNTAIAFYKIMSFLGAETVHNHADYRLMSKRAVEGLLCFKEKNLFLRGMVPLVGFKSDKVFYERSERFAGESKYPLKKMLSFAIDGITSFSVKPIRCITGIGFIMFLVSIALLVYSVIRWAIGASVLGWASLICSVWAIGGLIMLSLGIIGEYIGKMYLEVKGRPSFIIETVLENEDNR